MTVSAPEPTPAKARAERIAAAGARRAALSVRSARVAGTAGLGGQRRADPAVRPRRGDKATHVGALSQGAGENGALQLHASAGGAEQLPWAGAAATWSKCVEQ